jgi:hypothetical protein
MLQLERGSGEEELEKGKITFGRMKELEKI